MNSPLSKPLLALFLVSFMTTAFVARAHSAPDLVADSGTLPLRNLQIEVRQLRGSLQSHDRLSASGAVVLQPGQSAGRVDISAQNSQRSDAEERVQRVLVLNGRSASITLGNTVPLRLLQGFLQNGQVRYGIGTVLVQTNSGFSARPLWRGADNAELELDALQSSAGTASLPTGARVTTGLVVRLNEWVTVAQSDEVSAAAISGRLDAGQSAVRSALTVQVRISVR